MSEDLIRRSDAINAINVYDDTAYALQDVQRITDGIAKVVNAIPSADIPQGEWKVRGNPKRNLWECSLCRCTIYSESESDRNEFHKWCGRCGARMKGADDEASD